MEEFNTQAIYENKDQILSIIKNIDSLKSQKTQINHDISELIKKIAIILNVKPAVIRKILERIKKPEEQIVLEDEQIRQIEKILI